jgi:hypothetical protein
MDTQWITVGSFPSEAAAVLAIASLEAESLPAQLRSSAPVIGWPEYRVLVPDQYLAEAKTVIQAQRVSASGDVHTVPPSPMTISRTRQQIQNWRALLALGSLMLVGAAVATTTRVISATAGTAIALPGLVIGLVGLGGMNHIPCPRCGGYVVDPWSRWQPFFSSTCIHCGLSFKDED